MRLGQIGPIRVGGGFMPNIPRRPYDYPPERLTEFLNFKTYNDEAVFEFCSRYQIIFPTSDPEEIVRRFKEEQKKLVRIKDNLLAGILTSDDLNEINSQLGKIRYAVSTPNNDEIDVSNSPNGIRRHYGKVDLSLNFRHGDSMASLWLDLIEGLIEKQNIKQCDNCGELFRAVSKHKRKHCSDACKDLYSKRKRRTDKK